MLKLQYAKKSWLQKREKLCKNSLFITGLGDSSVNLEQRQELLTLHIIKVLKQKF